jgi:ubiquinone/menaquinone biosynthesis C-methylase UbiE
MQPEMQVKQQVREFYNQIGWQEQSDGFYQNASYEDLRPVSQEYIHKCHLRVLRHLNPGGRFLLDAGSGPIQYPEYLEYSRGYQKRVCADISLVALLEARKRIGGHGLFVVCDIAYLPFKAECFDGEVSLHTLHHLPMDEHQRAYLELHRTLALGGKAVVVNGWSKPPLAVLANVWLNLFDWLYAIFRPQAKPAEPARTDRSASQGTARRGTYVRKENAAWLQKEIGSRIPVQIWCWRSVSVRFLRTFIHPRFGGKFFLKVLYWKEELLPHFLGKYGQYPLVELTKQKVED